ncbi:MAG: sulfotransferase [Acidobacteriota bacterium]|nr:sulfotransferase [Acidobacteriota bacterium]
MPSGSQGATRPIIILGVDRSGTSLVASMVAAWGAYEGADDGMSQGDDANPEGYWEYGALKPLNNELLEGEKVSHWHPTFRMLVKERASDPVMSEKAKRLITGMESANSPWFWKEPDVCVTLPFWKQLWKDPLYVITVRNPHDTAVSWKKFILPDEMQDQYPLMTANLLRWQFYLLSILAEVDAAKEKIFIQYETLLKSPREEAEKLDRFLSAGCEIEAGDEERVSAMAGRIRSSLWRNKSPVPLSRVPQASKEQKAFYELLKKKVTRPSEPFVAARYPMYAGYWEYLELVDLIL